MFQSGEGKEPDLDRGGQPAGHQRTAPETEGTAAVHIVKHVTSDIILTCE